MQTNNKPAGLTFSTGTWITLLSCVASILASIWSFTIVVSADIRELKTDCRAFRADCDRIVQRIDRLEAPLFGIFPKPKADQANN
jgi:hypothetical protein